MFAKPTFSAVVTCTADAAVLWQDNIDGRALAAAVSTECAAVVTDEQRLYIWSPSGRRLLPPLILAVRRPCWCLKG